MIGNLRTYFNGLRSNHQLWKLRGKGNKKSTVAILPSSDTDQPRSPIPFRMTPKETFSPRMHIQIHNQESSAAVSSTNDVLCTTRTTRERTRTQNIVINRLEFSNTYGLYYDIIDGLNHGAVHTLKNYCSLVSKTKKIQLSQSKWFKKHNRDSRDICKKAREELWYYCLKNLNSVTFPLCVQRTLPSSCSKWSTPVKD